MTDMATSQNQRPTTDVSPTEASSSIVRQETDRGTTTIDESVVAKIAGIAAREVEGVASLGGAVSGAIAGVVSRVRGGSEHGTAGVGVEVGSRQAAVDLTLTVLYPAVIPDVATNVRDNVAERIERLTGLEVVEVNIAITDLRFEGEEDEDTGRGLQ